MRHPSYVEPKDGKMGRGHGAGGAPMNCGVAASLCERCPKVTQ